MKTERITNSSRFNKLSTITAAIVLGLGASACTAENSEGAPTDKASACGESLIGSTEEGWTDGAAKKALIEARDEAVTTIISKRNGGEALGSLYKMDTSSDIYSDARKAVSLANKTDTLTPDVGDKFEACTTVSLSQDGEWTTEVDSARVSDLPNNQ